MNLIGILGGTFDPIHYAHLRVALEVLETLEADHVRMIPCHQSPLRDKPFATDQHRLEMLQLAIYEQEGLQVDTRELLREGPSYSVETLAELRKAFPDAALCLVVGEDAFASFTKWHDWQGILALAHIIIATRPGYTAEIRGEAGQLLKQRLVGEKQALIQQQAGCIYPLAVTALDISATQIRKLILAGKSPRYLLPDAVLNYIQEHGLYQ